MFWNQKKKIHKIPPSSSTSSLSNPKMMLKAILALLALASFLVEPMPCGYSLPSTLQT